MSSKRISLVVACAAAVALVLASPVAQTAFGVTYTWTQTTGGSYAWDTPTNWGGTTPNPISGDTVDFSTVDIDADMALTLDADRTATTWQFGDTAGTQNWTVDSGTPGGKLILAGTTPTINVVQNTATINAIVDGTAGLTKSGSGTLTLAAANTYTGVTSITGGTLSVGSVVVSGGASGLGNATSAVILGGGGILNYTGNTATYTRGFTINAGGGEVDVANSGQTLTVNTALSLASGGLTVGGAGNVTINTGTTIPLSGTNTLTKNGAGTLTLQTTNARSINSAMPIVINQGTLTQNITTKTNLSNPLGTSSITLAAANDAKLNVTNAGATDSYANAIKVNGGSGTAVIQNSSGLMTFSGAVSFVSGTSDTNLQLNNGNGSGGSYLTFTGGVTGTGNIIFNGTGGGSPINLTTADVNNTGTLTNIGTNAAGVVTISASIGGNVTGVIQNATAPMTLSGNNTFLGGVSLTKGTLTLGSNTALGGAAGTFTINGGTLDVSSARTTPNNNPVTINGNFTFTGTNSLDLGAGAISLGTAAGTSRTITVGANTLTLGGVISDGTTANSLTKAGAGTLVLSGTNTYTGTTTVSAGMLRFAKMASLYNSDTAKWTAANINVKSGATLALNVDSAGTAGFTSTNLNTLLTKISVANTAAEGLQSGANLVFDTSTATGATFTHSVPIADSTGANGGAIGVTKLGAGTLILDQTSTYTGGTTVNAGTLALAGGNNRLPTTGVVSFDGANGSTATLDIGGTSQTLSTITIPSTNIQASGNTLTANITGSGGTLTVNGASDLLLGPTTPGTLTPATTINMSGLSNFIYTASNNSFNAQPSGSVTYEVGVPATTVTLAANNTITAANFNVGANGGAGGGGVNILNLGTTNALNVGNINVGAAGRSDATLRFAAGLTNPTLVVRGTDGSSPAASWNVGKVADNAQSTWTDKVDLTAGSGGTAGTLDALVTTLAIGVSDIGTQGTRQGTVNAFFTVGATTGQNLTVTNLNVGQIAGNAALNGVYASSGTFTLNSPSGIVNAGTITLATNTLTDTANKARTVGGTFNLTDGTLYATTVRKGDQTGTATNVTVTLAFNWANGTIRNIAGGDLNFTKVPT